MTILLKKAFINHMLISFNGAEITRTSHKQLYFYYYFFIALLRYYYFVTTLLLFYYLLTNVNEDL